MVTDLKGGYLHRNDRRQIMHHHLLRIAAALCGIVAATPVVAHPTLENQTATVGRPYKATFRMPHGCDGAATVKVTVQIPEGVIGVKPMPKPGWQVEVVKGPYAKAYPYFHGEIKEGARTVSWSGGKLPDDFYDEFTFASVLAADLPVDTRIYFPVIQDCEKGSQRWSDVAKPGEDAHALKFPAPGLTLVAQQRTAQADTRTYKAGSIVVEAPWSRATPGGAKVAGGYMKITNTGKEPDRLVGGSLPVAARMETHEMTTENGVMKMRHLPAGLEIKPGETVELKPGGYHLMFMDLRQGLKDGQTIKGTLNFEKAGPLEVEYRVGAIGARDGGGEHDNH
jgi:uncharacterized protein YcnI/copper(I)-binding protein